MPLTGSHGGRLALISLFRRLVEPTRAWRVLQQLLSFREIIKEGRSRTMRGLITVMSYTRVGTHPYWPNLSRLLAASPGEIALRGDI
jgi:hypothetical protein